MNRPPHQMNAEKEQEFHDAWAGAAGSDHMDVRKISEACTAPEIRFIRKALGPLAGRRLLDLGCGFGEVSVYFALEGAEVTAVDISQRMVEQTRRLAAAYNVAVRAYAMPAGEIHRLPQEDFDIIYAGNFFHHVDIASVLPLVAQRLKPGGVLMSWDPLIYNPLIKVYRWLARKVRTVGEHPLGMGDIRLFRQHFGKVETRWFWFLTTVIFIIMFLFQLKNPSRERYWRRVLKDADYWQGLYKPLETMDRFLLKWLPFLRPLCWNVLIVASQPKKEKSE